MRGAWDSIHVVEVQEAGRSATYKLTSTIMLYMKTNKPGHGEMNLSGSMTRQVESKDTALEDPSQHIANIGRLIEESEIKMRNSLQEIYFGKTKDIVNDLRSMRASSEMKQQADMAAELASKLAQRN